MAYIASHKNAWNATLEPKGVSRGVPSGWPRTVSKQMVPGKDMAATVSIHRSVEPIGLSLSPNEHEHGLGVDILGFTRLEKGQAYKMVLASGLRDSRSSTDPYVLGFRDLGDEVVRHSL